MDKVLLWYILGTRGGLTRANIIKKLNERPYNANQLSKILNLNYRTITHHLKQLEDGKLIQSTEDGYGKMYFLSEKMKSKYDEFETILDKLEK